MKKPGKEYTHKDYLKNLNDPAYWTAIIAILLLILHLLVNHGL